MCKMSYTIYIYSVFYVLYIKYQALVYYISLKQKVNIMEHLWTGHY